MTHRDPRGSQRSGEVATDTHILIVDHDRRVSASLTFMLAARGYQEVRAVRSAARAIAVAAIFHPGLVFLDLELPDASSLEVAGRIRRAGHQPALRLIALTLQVDHPLREDARIAGFERFMVKPPTQIELDKVLRRPSDAVAP